MGDIFAWIIGYLVVGTLWFVWHMPAAARSVESLPDDLRAQVNRQPWLFWLGGLGGSLVLWPFWLVRRLFGSTG